MITDSGLISMTYERSIASPPAGHPIIERVQCMITFNRSRQVAFGGGLFADPAWDLLLQIFLADLSYSELSEARLLESIDVPNSVAVRWLSSLAERGDVEFQQVGEQRSVRLSKRGRNAMDQLFDQLPESPCC